MFKICSEKMTQVYDYKSFINYVLLKNPILRGYYNSMLIGINSPKVVEDPILRGYHNHTN